MPSRRQVTSAAAALCLGTAGCTNDDGGAPTTTGETGATTDPASENRERLVLDRVEPAALDGETVLAFSPDLRSWLGSAAAGRHAGGRVVAPEDERSSPLSALGPVRLLAEDVDRGTFQYRVEMRPPYAFPFTSEQVDEPPADAEPLELDTVDREARHDLRQIIEADRTAVEGWTAAYGVLEERMDASGVTEPGTTDLRLDGTVHRVRKHPITPEPYPGYAVAATAVETDSDPTATLWIGEVPADARGIVTETLASRSDGGAKYELAELPGSVENLAERADALLTHAGVFRVDVEPVVPT